MKTFFPPILIYAVIYYLSSRPAAALPDILPDIIPHFLEYLVLGFFLIRAVLTATPGKIPPSPAAPSNGRLRFPAKKIIIIGIILLILAFLDELHQYYVPTRYFQLKDIFVDFLGSITGIILYAKMREKRVER